MPQGDNSACTDRLKRQPEPIEKGYEKKGLASPEAESHAWATVNKTSGSCGQ